MEFKLKTAEELEAMSPEEVTKYWHDKLEFEKKELENRMKALEDENNSEKLEKLTEEVRKLNEDKMNTLETAYKEQGRVIKALKDKQVSGESVQTIDQAIKSALESNKDNIAKIALENSKEAVNFSIKVAGDMTIAGNITGDVPQAQRIPGVNNIVERTPRVMDLLVPFPVSPDRNSVDWIFETGQDGTISGTAEGNAKDQIDNDFEVNTISLKKRAAFFKASTEMLGDITFMQAWLRNKLIIRLTLDVDNEVLNGTDVGQSFNGLINQSTASSFGAPFALGVDNANEIDVLVAAMDQIEQAEHEMMRPVILMHPTDVNFLKTTKVSTTDKRYVERVTLAAGQLSVDGVPIIKSTAMTQGDYLVGDFALAMLAFKDAFNVEIGLDGNDFTQNKRTILAEYRGEVILEDNYVTAFVNGDFTTDKAALETA